LHGLERIEQLLDNSAILSTHVRARASVNALEGVGIAEAPRGTLIHHYEVDESGAMRKANLIIATGHNNLAIGRSITQAAKAYVHGPEVPEEALNRIQAVVRAYDPCLSCSTHAAGVPDFEIQVRGPGGQLL
jgi:NAD-reducing hydrogenase large subunit